MNRESSQKAISLCAFAVAALAVTAPTVLADVRPPVRIHMPLDTLQAESGRTYTGAFLIEARRPGEVTDIDIRGEGWEILNVTLPDQPYNIADETIAIAFRAIPEDADKPLGLSLHFDGRWAHRAYEIGPAYAAQIGVPAPVYSFRTPEDIPLERDHASLTPTGPTITPAAGGLRAEVNLTVRGQIVYDRPNALDGFGNPMGGTSQQAVHGIRVRVMDDDDTSADDILWEGFTDERGRFDTGSFLVDDPNGPDVYLEIESEGVATIVKKPTLGDESYFWDNEASTIVDFGGGTIDYGVLLLGDNPQAAHILSSIERTRIFTWNEGGLGPVRVTTIWPDGGNNAFYDGSINISARREWEEAVHVHEYGHHVMEEFSLNVPPDYCNAGTAYCDFASGIPGCYQADLGQCSHCIWCPETDHDAWNEGFPNWLGDVVTRTMPQEYEFLDGSPWTALFTLSQESLNTCCQDGSSGDPLITEGFVGALLRDMEDETQDDHDGDWVFDNMCGATFKIFNVMSLHDPTTISEFIADYLAEYPDETDELWATAFNVAPAYVTGFPTDTQLPDAPPSASSPSHPLGVGGNMPCITVEWDHASDDVSGICGYSYAFTQGPPVSGPDNTADPFDPTGCRASVTEGPFNLGDWYLSVRAQDCAGNWGLSWSQFGPFTVTECNDNGILDICEIACDISTLGLACGGSSSYCSSLYFSSCGAGSDCNNNFAPDDCDLAGGTSEDCNLDDIPDDCQAMKHWSGDFDGQWGASGNWEEVSIPVEDDHICIENVGQFPTATFKVGSMRVSSLSSDLGFTIDGSSSNWRELELGGPSFIAGDLNMTGGAVLNHNVDLPVDGIFTWAGGYLIGGGTTTVAGGLNLTQSTVRLWSPHRLIISGGAANAGNRLMALSGSAVLTIGAGVTYTYSGDFGIFSGGTTTTIDVDGTLLRNGGSGDVNVSSFVDNSGLIHNQVGELVLVYGGLHNGDILGDPGTQMTLGRTHELLPTSSLTVDDVEFSGGNGSNIRGDVHIAGLLKVDGGTWTFTNEANVASYGQDLFVRAGNAKLQAPTVNPSLDFDTVTVGETGVSGGVGAYFDSGQPVSIGTLTVVKGAIYGVDPITVHDSFVWTGDSLSTGGDVTAAGAAEIRYTNQTRTLLRVLEIAGNATMRAGLGMSGGGRLDVSTSGVLEFINQSSISGRSVNNAGTVLKTGVDSSSTLFATTFNNAGTVDLRIGELFLQQGSYVQTAGQTILNGSSIGSHLMPPIQIDGGTFMGVGTAQIDVNIAGGTAAPGLSTGELIVDGDYMQTSNGTLAIEIAGSGIGQHDLLTVTGTAQLSGILDVSDVSSNGCTQPATGSVTIVSAGSASGTFDVENVPAHYGIVYTATEVILQSSLPTADLNGDGSIDLRDFALFQRCHGGAGMPAAANCPAGVDADFDSDGDVDACDLATFAGALAPVPMP